MRRTYWLRQDSGVCFTDHCQARRPCSESQREDRGERRESGRFGAYARSGSADPFGPPGGHEGAGLEVFGIDKSHGEVGVRELTWTECLDTRCRQ